MKVTAVHVNPAPAHERRRGLLAWLTVEVNGLALDGFALRRTLKGRLYAALPKRKDVNGRLHLQVWLLDRRDRQSLQDQILAAIDFEELAR